jgi:hypothetical protein
VNTVFSGEVPALVPVAASLTTSVSITVPRRTNPAATPPATALAVLAVVARSALGTVASAKATRIAVD